VAAVYGAARHFQATPKTATVALCVIAAGFGLRAMARNPDWHDEQSLWTSALAVSPGSFRVHLALSYVLSEKQPQPQYIDEAIAEAEKGLAILNTVPDRYCFSMPYVEAAKRYITKAELSGGRLT